jgi:hypothetical protein
MRTFVACALLLVSTSVLGQPIHQPPTATELFNLRGMCAQLGEKIMRENVVGIALTQSQTSRYDPRTSRCFVELTVQTMDLSKADYFARYLFDGQTNEMLAALRNEKGKRWGMVYDRNHKGGSLTNAGFDDASGYINKMMSNE